MSELRPCPFCGGEALLRERYIEGIANRKHYRRECRHCKATFADWYRSIKKANEAWNRRVDAVPVVHGEWELFDECSNDGVYCSICHKAVYRESAWYKNVHIKSKYCPNCGARMDKEDET